MELIEEEEKQDLSELRSSIQNTLIFTRVSPTSTFKKHHLSESNKLTLSYTDSISILIARIIGVSYLYFPISFDGGLYIVYFVMLIMNFMMGLLSSWIILDLKANCQQLNTLQEIVLYISDDRKKFNLALTYIVNAAFIVIYILNPATYLTTIADSVSMIMIRLNEANVSCNNDGTFDYGGKYYSTIILLSGLVLSPACLLIKFEHFRSLSFVFNAMLVVIFISIVSGLIYNSFVGSNYEQQCNNISEPLENGIEQGELTFVTYLYMMPMFAQASYFELAILPVHSQSTPRTAQQFVKQRHYDRSFKACIYSSLISAFYYISLLYAVGIYYDYMGEDSKDYNLHSFQIQTILSVISIYLSTPFVVVVNIALIIQCYVQVVFSFYISQEQLLILVDQVMHNTLIVKIHQLLIDESKNNYKPTLSYKCNPSFIGLIDSDNVQKPKYFLDYMNMSNKIKIPVKVFLFLFNVITALFLYNVNFVLNLLNAFAIPFVILIVPVSLYIILSRTKPTIVSDKVLSYLKYGKVLIGLGYVLLAFYFAATIETQILGVVINPISIAK